VSHFGRAERQFPVNREHPVKASREAVRPRHDVATSLRQLNLADTSALDPTLFKKMILRGDQLFKQPRLPLIQRS
jgi:hypothetical protein